MAPVIKRRTRPIERAPITTARTVLVTTARMTIIERITTIKRILVVSEHKKGSKDKYYRLY